jgi:hypothetical protein
MNETHRERATCALYVLVGAVIGSALAGNTTAAHSYIAAAVIAWALRDAGPRS